MLSKESASTVSSVLFPKPKDWVKTKYNGLEYAEEEEQLFNDVFTKVIEGRRHRCTRLVFTKDKVVGVDKGNLVNHNTRLVQSFLSRIITPKAPFVGYPNGKTAVSAIVKKFRRELAVTVADGYPGERLLCTDEAYQIVCEFVTYGADPSTFEGTMAVELCWYASYIKDGKERVRPLVHTFASGCKL